jgi:hypothetical protein
MVAAMSRMRTYGAAYRAGGFYDRNFSGRCGARSVAVMKKIISPNERPLVHVAVRSAPWGARVRVRVSWSFGLSGRTAARLLVVAVLVLAAAAVVASADGELARGVVCSLAGFLAGSRPRSRS